MKGNELQIFNYTGREVRILEIDGEPWWVAKDVCDILEIKQTGRAISRLDIDEVNSIHLPDATNCLQQTYVINEPGLYSLILGSRKPEALQFKRWVTHEVLPQIRKTGAYIAKSSDNEQLTKSIENLTVKFLYMQRRLDAFEKAPQQPVFQRPYPRVRNKIYNPRRRMVVVGSTIDYNKITMKVDKDRWDKFNANREKYNLSYKMIFMAGIQKIKETQGIDLGL